MPSGANRRRKAAKKKKKDAAISNGNGEVKILEGNGGDNASQHLETQQNLIIKDVDDEKTSLLNESRRRKMLNGEVVGIVGKEAESKNSSMKNSTIGSLSAAKDESQLVENGHSKVATDSVSSAFPNEANHVKNAIHSFTENVIHQAECPPVQKSFGSAVADLKLMKFEEKVHPSETFSDLEAETFQTHETHCGEASMEFVAKILPQSATPIANSEWNSGSSEVQHSAEKEPLLLPHSRKVNKTSWSGCCGLLELLTGSSR